MGETSATPARAPLTWSTVLLAAGITFAPFVVQTAVLVLTQSLRATIVAGALLAALFVAGGFAMQARIAGSFRAVPFGSRLGVVLSVVTYHLLALPIAWLLNARFFAEAGGAP